MDQKLKTTILLVDYENIQFFEFGWWLDILETLIIWLEKSKLQETFVTLWN